MTVSTMIPPAGEEKDLDNLRVVAVHAHPDDEALWTGGALAQLSRRGAHVTVVTCTLGEEGEVIGEPLKRLVADEANCLGGYRISELAHSLKRLGCEGRFLGGAGRWRDSGMAGSPSSTNPRAFVKSGARAVAELSDILSDLKPDLVLTYGPDGGYGHPDHIKAHEITMQACAELADDDVIDPTILWAVTEHDAYEDGIKAIDTIPEGWRLPEPGEIALVDHAEHFFTLTDADVDAKADAMAAHATQVWLADGRTSSTNPKAARATTKTSSTVRYVFALSNLIAQPILHREFYQLARRGRVDINRLVVHRDS